MEFQQKGVNNLINFCFCLYLVFSYGKKYTGQGKEGSEEKNIFQRTMNMICYDYSVCLYMICLVFFIVWVILSHHYYSSENTQSQCSLESNGFMMKIFLFNLLSMDIYLIGGIVIFIICLIIAACDEGSCTFHDVCRCMTLCCTCGCWDIGKSEEKKNKEYNPNRYQYAQQNRQNYTEQRVSWLDKSKRLLAGFGLISNNQRPAAQPVQQPNNNTSMYQLQNQQPNQVPVQHNYQPQQQQQFQNNPYLVQNNNPYLQNNNNPYQQNYNQPPQQQYNQQYQPAQQQMPPPQYNYQQYQQNPQQNPQNLQYNPNQNQNPYANQPEEPPKEKKGFLDKVKDGATNIKNKLFK